MAGCGHKAWRLLSDFCWIYFVSVGWFIHVCEYMVFHLYILELELGCPAVTH